MFLKVGPTLELITDNGTNFTSHKFKQLMQKYSYEHAKGSPRHHQGNEAAEKSGTHTQAKNSPKQHCISASYSSCYLLIHKGYLLQIFSIYWKYYSTKKIIFWRYIFVRLMVVCCEGFRVKDGKTNWINMCWLNLK